MITYWAVVKIVSPTGLWITWPDSYSTQEEAQQESNT